MMHYEIQSILSNLQAIEPDKLETHIKLGLIEAIGILAGELQMFNNSTSYRLEISIREGLDGISQVINEKASK